MVCPMCVTAAGVGAAAGGAANEVLGRHFAFFSDYPAVLPVVFGTGAFLLGGGAVYWIYTSVFVGVQPAITEFKKTCEKGRCSGEEVTKLRNKVCSESVHQEIAGLSDKLDLVHFCANSVAGDEYVIQETLT